MIGSTLFNLSIRYLQYKINVISRFAGFRARMFVEVSAHIWKSNFLYKEFLIKKLFLQFPMFLNIWRGSNGIYSATMIKFWHYFNERLLSFWIKTSICQLDPFCSMIFNPFLRNIISFKFLIPEITCQKCSYDQKESFCFQETNFNLRFCEL